MNNVDKVAKLTEDGERERQRRVKEAARDFTGKWPRESRERIKRLMRSDV